MLKPWAQASHFEYHEAYKRNKKFWREILHKKLTEYLKTSWSDQIWFIFMSICIVPKHNSSQDIEVYEMVTLACWQGCEKTNIETTSFNTIEINLVSLGAEAIWYGPQGGIFFLASCEQR